MDFIKKLFYLFFSLFLLITSAEAASTGKFGMVVSEQALASHIGVDILKAGGNAIDAAVAVGYALAVVNPCCGNIGGGGFMTIHLANGKNIFLNFREKAPLKASKNMYLNKQGQLIPHATTTGYLAVAVPGTVLGLDTALQKYGTLSRQQVMLPAIRLAKEGYIVTSYDEKLFTQFQTEFRQQSTVAAIFLNKNQVYHAGQRLIQTDLANTLQAIADQGADVFYRGFIAKKIVTASQQQGGLLSLADFANYTVEELAPINCSYHGYQIISAPPPSSGGITLCEILNILEQFPLQELAYRSSESVRILVEAMRDGFRDRNNKLGDPDFVHNPVQQLLSKAYAKKLSQAIQQMLMAPAEKSIPEPELTDTTHYSVIDNKGNAVAVTYTLNGFFGARVIADHTGFFLNDEMDDFAAQPGTANKFGLVQNDANAIQPGKRPLSSMTPTIVLKNNRLFMVLGSPGGPRIITTVLLTLLNVIDYHFDLQQAVDAARFHYQGEPDVIDVEPFAFSFLTTTQLKLMGYSISPENTWGAVEAILVNPTDHILYGANDVRRPAGAAIAY